MTASRALVFCVAATALGIGGCAAATPPGKLLKAPVEAGKSKLRIREIALGPGPYPKTKRGYYTEDGKEVIPARFAHVSFMNDTIGFTVEGKTHYRVRFDITGKKSAEFDKLPFREVRAFERSRMSAAALAHRNAWYGIVDKPHPVQDRHAVDMAILDENGDVAETIFDVLVEWGFKREEPPSQQGAALQFHVMPAEGDPVHIVTDLTGVQTEPMMPNLKRFRSFDPVVAYRTNNRVSFNVLALPVGSGRFAPFAPDGHLRRLTEPGLLGYRPDGLNEAASLKYWWKDYDIDGERFTGWANADLDGESGPIWRVDSVKLVGAGGLLAQRRDGPWEFYIGPGALSETGDPTPVNRYDEFPWAKVKPQTFTEREAAVAAAELPVERWRQVQRARAQKEDARRLAEAERRKGFLDAVERGSEREACTFVARAETQQQYREIDVVVARLHGSSASAICGVSLSTLVEVLRDPKSRSMVVALRQVERERMAEADARDRARRAAEQKEQARQEQLAQQQAAAQQAASFKGGTWAPRTPSQGSSSNAESSRAYTKALNDWTYGKTSWRPYKK